MIVFHNAKLFSPQHPGATAFVIDHGCFLAIGSESEILDSFTHAQAIINLEGKTVLPGLTDAHVHLQHLAESMEMVNCETDSLQECLARIKAKAEDLPEGAWVRGHGWNQNRWDGVFGHKEQLDHVCKGHPAYLTAKSLHAAWANSEAMAAAGINSQTSDPPSGVIQKDDEGQPTGILLEAGAMKMIETVIPKPSITALTEKIKQLIPELWKCGLVGVHDFDGFDCWQALQTLHQERSLHLRVRKNIPYDHLEAFLNAGLRTDYGDDWLHLGSVKLFSDGALGPQTGAMLAPYEGTGERGTLLLSEGDIVEIGKQVIDNGVALTIHAIGDLANHVVLNAYEKLRTYEVKNNLQHLRHRIEHVQVIHADDLPRLAKLDIIASLQPVHAPSDMFIADQYLGARTKSAYAYRSLLDTGATCVFGSDAPVEPVNPFHGIHAAVTRRRSDGSPGPEGWHPEQRLSLKEALIGFSRTPAEIANRGSRLGRIEAGHQADFLLLEEDPFAIDPQSLWRIQPLATYISGKCVYNPKNMAVDLSL